MEWDPKHHVHNFDRILFGGGMACTVCDAIEPEAFNIEKRVTDPITGGQKGEKMARFDLIPPDVLTELANHYGAGVDKYPNDAPAYPGEANWQKGYAWHLCLAALERHLMAWANGEDVDEDTGSNHLIAVAWHAFALRWFQLHDKGTDDIAGRQISRGLKWEDEREIGVDDVVRLPKSVMAPAHIQRWQNSPLETVDDELTRTNIDALIDEYGYGPWVADSLNGPQEPRPMTTVGAPPRYFPKGGVH